MAVEVCILKEGYSFMDEKSKTMTANGSCTLVREDGTNVIVDTLTAWDREFLVEELQRRELRCEDITYVVCTHGHSDHIGNLNLFTQATHIVGQSVSRSDQYFFHPFDEDVPYTITENIQVIPTPGHTLSDVSIVVKNTSLGTVVIAGDLFEKQEDIANPYLWRESAGSENPTLQYKNRQRVLQMAEYIIPGHGPMFKISEDLIKLHCNDESSH